MLTKLKDTRRRAKQQFLQTVGLANASEDSDFEALHLEYKTTIASLESIQTKMRAHVSLLQQVHDKAAELTTEISAFHKNTASSEAARALAKAHADNVAAAAAVRMYEESVIAPIDLILWQAPEVETKVRERKTLLLDYNAHLRKYQASNAALQKSADALNTSTSLVQLGRRKSEAELAEDVATRKVRVEHAEAALLDSTEWLMNQFNDLADKKEKGLVLETPMPALAAVQSMLAGDASAKVTKALPFFPQVDHYLSTLERFATEIKAHTPAQVDLEDQVSEQSHGSAVFGRPLSGSGRVPAIVKECVAFLEVRGVQLEGVFRVPGNTSVVQALREQYDHGEMDCLNVDTDPHDVATLLKLYFRELPKPVVSQDVFEKIIEVARDLQGEVRKDAVCEAVLTLPIQNLAVLALLLNLLQRIARNSPTNKMNSTNLATCFAPTILRAPVDASPAEVLNDMQHAITAFKIMVDEARRFAPQRENSRLEASSVNQSKVAAAAAKDLPPLPGRAGSNNRTSSRLREL